MEHYLASSIPYFANIDFQTDIDNLILRMDSKENQIFTLISTIVLLYMFASKYAGKSKTHLSVGTKYVTINTKKEVMCFIYNKTTKFKGKWRSFR